MTQKQIQQRKKQAVDSFRRQLAKTEESEFVDKLILYGSVAGGRAEEDSDIDILIFSKKPAKVEEKVEDIALKIMLDKGEYIEPFVIPSREYKSPSSYFIYNALKRGKEINLHVAKRQ